MRGLLVEGNKRRNVSARLATKVKFKSSQLPVAPLRAQHTCLFRHVALGKQDLLDAAAVEVLEIAADAHHRFRGRNRFEVADLDRTRFAFPLTKQL